MLELFARQLRLLGATDHQKTDQCAAVAWPPPESIGRLAAFCMHRCPKAPSSQSTIHFPCSCAAGCWSSLVRVQARRQASGSQQGRLCISFVFVQNVLRCTRGYSPFLDSAPVSALGSWRLAHCRQAGVPCLSSLATLSFNSAPDCAFRESSGSSIRSKSHVVAPSRRHHLAVSPAANFPLQWHTNLVTSMAFLSMKGPSVPGALVTTGPPLIFFPC